MLRIVFALFVLCFAGAASAYIGPGAGISVLGSIISVVIGVVLAIAAIVLWPLRRMLKKKKAQETSQESDA